jgi:hypothetical protein
VSHNSFPLESTSLSPFLSSWHECLWLLTAPEVGNDHPQLSQTAHSSSRSVVQHDELQSELLINTVSALYH